MKKNRFDTSYWNERYIAKNTGWDLSQIAPPIKSYIDQLSNKDLKILIPGAGNSYEAEYLWEKGFKNVNILDIADQPLLNFLTRVPHFPKKQCLHKDFFKLNTTFDLILEQTFFCALDPLLRADYVKTIHNALSKKGKLVGLLFDFPLTENGPPFGGNKEMYINYFEPYFNLLHLERAYNSVDSRKDKELFFIFDKK